MFEPLGKAIDTATAVYRASAGVLNLVTSIGALTIKAASGQTGELLRVEDSSGNALFVARADGDIVVGSGTQIRQDSNRTHIEIANNNMDFRAGQSDHIRLLNNGSMRFGDHSSPSGSFLAEFKGGTYIHLGAPASAPTTGDMENGSVVFWLDETNNQLEVSAKYSDGTVVSGTVSLS